MSDYCGRCDGMGFVVYPAPHPEDAWADQWEPCPSCAAAPDTEEATR